jgi:hypothetical protein
MMDKTGLDRLRQRIEDKRLLDEVAYQEDILNGDEMAISKKTMVKESRDKKRWNKKGKK